MARRHRSIEWSLDRSSNQYDFFETWDFDAASAGAYRQFHVPIEILPLRAVRVF